MNIFTLTMTPINPPADDSVKNMAMGLAENIEKHRFFFISYPFSAAFEKRNNVKFILSPFQRPGKHNMTFLQKAFALFIMVLYAGKVDIFQFFITPQRYFSGFFRWFLKRARKKSILVLSSINTLGLKNSKGAVKDLFFSDHVITYTDFSKKELESAGVKNVMRIYPGIDVDRFDAERTISPRIVSGKQKNILYAGSYGILNDSYSLEKLCLIAKRIAELREDAAFVMACRIRTRRDMFLEKDFKLMVSKYGLSKKFTFLNTVRNIAELYKGCDIGIMPASHKMSGVLEIPMVLLEMSCMSKCVVYTDVAPLNELSSNGIGVMLPAISSPESYAETIARILGDRPRCSEIGERSKRAVRERFNIVKMAARYSELYDSLAG